MTQSKVDAFEVVSQWSYLVQRGVGVLRYWYQERRYTAEDVIYMNPLEFEKRCYCGFWFRQSDRSDERPLSDGTTTCWTIACKLLPCRRRAWSMQAISVGDTLFHWAWVARVMAECTIPPNTFRRSLGTWADAGATLVKRPSNANKRTCRSHRFPAVYPIKNVRLLNQDWSRAVAMYDRSSNRSMYWRRGFVDRQVATSNTSCNRSMSSERGDRLL